MLESWHKGNNAASVMSLVVNEASFNTGCPYKPDLRIHKGSIPE